MNFKISVCIVSRNRLFHVRETLPVSIVTNYDYANIEYILLDYNSSDGLENWVSQMMRQYIDSGILKYFRTDKPSFFDICHSKNLAANLSNGDILCFLDADNYLGDNFAEWINLTFNNFGDKTVITTIRRNYTPFRDVGGKIVVAKKEFIAAKGFDESRIGYGFDDVDLLQRLENNGCSRYFIDKSEYLQFISHTHVERICNGYLLTSISDIFVNIHNDTSRSVLYLLNNKTFYFIKYTFLESEKNNNFTTYKGWKVEPGDWNEGVYEMLYPLLKLFPSAECYIPCTQFNFNDIIFFGKWTKVSEGIDMFTEYLMMCSECQGRYKYWNHLENFSEINVNGFGKGSVVELSTKK